MKIIEKLEKLRDKYPVDENLVLGLDIGIASCGWAVLDTKAKKILGAGTWGFEIPEVPKTRESKAAVRRVARGQRRRLRRRRQRMREIRKLLHQYGLLDSPLPRKDGEKGPRPAPDPWILRAQGLDRELSGEEFATALIHIAKHRGYRSNSKSDRAANAPAEDKKVLKGLAEIEEKSARYRTVGEMFAKDPEFAHKKRNRDGDYSYTVLRSLHEQEVKTLFKVQRRLGSGFADESLEKKFASLAFDQLPLQDSEKLLGHCPFEPGEKRASMQAYSFELFRFLSKLNNVRVEDGTTTGRKLTPTELSKAVSGFGKTGKSISWKSLIRRCGLPKNTTFKGVGEKNMGKDLARASKGAAFGSATLYGVLGESAWNSLLKTPEVLDAIAHIITFREDVGRIQAGLEELGLEPLVLQTLMDGVRSGAFAQFARAGHISTKAARNIIPGLLQGLTYDKACAQAGYDHTQENPANLSAITNPVARRAVLETLKQLNAILNHYQVRPGRVHMELGRDVGKGPKERGQIEKGIKDRTKAREKAKKEFCNLVGKSDCSNGELQKYELWKEQNGFCMFSYPKSYIDPYELLDGRHAVEIEHILPRSRSHDNSWNNKVLARVDQNREKKNRTPYEWFGNDPERWAEFEFRVKSAFNDKKIKGFKIRNLLMKDFAERERGFIERNKNDMRYAARVVNSEIARIYTDDEVQGKRRIFARAGQITGTLRRVWGLNRLKYLPTEDGKKERIEDERHHAVDAIVVAACTEGRLQQLTKAIQNLEEKGLRADRITNFPLPWEGFTEDVIAARDNAPVARSENRRGRGAGHEATVRKIRNENGLRIVYERKSIDKVTKADLDRLKDPERNKDVYDNVFAWIAAGKPQDTPPMRNNGHPIKKLTLRSEKNPTTERAGFVVRRGGGEGQVDNGEMVRVDVFEKDGKFYLVPIYVHQVMDQENWPNPPDKYIVKGKPEKEWGKINDYFTFKFSLYPFSWVEIVKRNRDEVKGFYRGTDRATASITLSREMSRAQLIRGIGYKTLHSFKKFHVDRLGHKSEIKSEKRTWHGVVCT